MTAQTAIAQQSAGSRYGALAAFLVAAALLVVALTLAFAMLASTTHPVTDSTPVFNAPAFRAEERTFVILPTFDDNTFRAEEREPLK